MIHTLQSVNDALRPKITVYAYSGYRPLRRFDDVPSGATALDFAFKIGCALAYTVTKARIKKCNAAPENVKFTESDYKYHLKTVLEDGDVVFLRRTIQTNLQSLRLKSNGSII